MTDIVKFNPVRVGMLDTLNWAAILVSNMWKHALEMFFSRRNVASIILMVVGAAHWG